MYLVWLIFSLCLSTVGAIDITVWADTAHDPYFQMTPANLNTMNSVIIPNVSHLEDTAHYPELKYTIQKDDTSLLGYSLVKDTTAWYKHIHIVSSYFGFLVVILWFVAIRYFAVKRASTSFGQGMRLVFDGVWDTFDNLLGDKASYSLKMYVVALFFIVLIANVLGVVNDMLRFVFPQLGKFVTAPTAEFETTLALAIVATLIPLGIQIRNLGFTSFLHEYVPITGKQMIEGKGLGTRLGDIIISLFVGLLDIVGLISKIISLSMRLLGNMSSWWILLNVLFLGLGGLLVSLLSNNIVVGIPIVLYIQGLLVAVVQAFVFAMLTSIGIKLVLEE